jgi:NADH-quinone oxidoreductase subunit H
VSYVIVLSILSFLLVFLLSVAYLTFFERKIIAYIQLRQGPNTTGPLGLLQPIADGIKLLHKEMVIPQVADKFLFFLAPIILFVLSFSLWAVVPFDQQRVFVNLNVGILYVLAISSLNVYSLILAGWASGSRYAFLGAMRSVSQMISYELSIGFTIVCIILLSSSLRLGDIVTSQKDMWNILPLFPLWVIFFTSCLAENNRAPFDLPESEAELVAGYNVEYSGFTYALFYLSEYGNMIFMSALNALLFMGGWLPPFQALSFIPGVVWFLIKIVFFLFLFIWIRASLPRFRYDQLMRLGWQFFLPISLFFVVIVGGWVVYAS